MLCRSRVPRRWDAGAPLGHLTAIADPRVVDSGGAKPDARLGLVGLEGIEPPTSGACGSRRAATALQPLGHLGPPRLQQTVWLLTAAHAAVTVLCRLGPSGGGRNRGDFADRTLGAARPTLDPT
jgi:hypothetical protein